LIGNNDIATGGDGPDGFVLGDWIDTAAAATITDFNSAEDIIVVSLKDANADAEVTTQEDGDDRLVLIDGVVVARVQGTFDALDGIDADIITTTYTTVV